MECLKRTNDLHTTQQCLMLLSKGAQLFPVEKIDLKIFTKFSRFVFSLGKTHFDDHGDVRVRW